MVPGARPSRPLSLVAASIAVVAVAAALPAPAQPDPATLPPNIILILTDDQSLDTLPSDPASMPWLQSQIFGNPAGDWLWFPNAFLNTPLCCPSRATILTGRYSHHTRVEGNEQGMNLDESNTLATWLKGGGYTTALIGKYLNNYPWNRGPYVPPGWDRFFGKRNEAEAETYYDYGVIDQGVPLFAGDTPDAYVTDLLADKAVDFLRRRARRAALLPDVHAAGSARASGPGAPLRRRVLRGAHRRAVRTGAERRGRASPGGSARCRRSRRAGPPRSSRPGAKSAKHCAPRTTPSGASSRRSRRAASWTGP